jgi:hypothetical protein
MGMSLVERRLAAWAPGLVLLLPSVFRCSKRPTSRSVIPRGAALSAWAAPAPAPVTTSAAATAAALVVGTAGAAAGAVLPLPPRLLALPSRLRDAAACAPMRDTLWRRRRRPWWMISAHLRHSTSPHSAHSLSAGSISHRAHDSARS